MRLDASRIRFEQSKNYTAVLEQQGRVALDADTNEQRLIDAYQSGTERIDVVGGYGGPVGDPGFMVTLTAAFNEILIGTGRYYVEGLLCDQIVSGLTYETQPYLKVSEGASAALLNQLKSSNGAQVIQVYLQAWQRLQTALDDQSLREPAIGTADTTARLQTVWRVLAGQSVPTPQVSSGTMIASTSDAGTNCGCAPVASAGYQGLENQLYRVEIHNPGDLTSATFKWSRENGSVVVKVTAVNGATVTVDSLGLDANLGFQVGQWVELTDDTYEFGAAPNAPGSLYQIASIQPADPSVILQVPAGQKITVDPSQRARMRRWDQSDASTTQTGIPLSAAALIQLENGIQVAFSAGTYQTGDCWTIPARALTGDIDWPPGVNLAPTSIKLYNAPLAVVSFVSAQNPPFQCEDKRQLFQPLTALTPPRPPAIHVTGISWVNESVMTVDQLAHAGGISITLDGNAVNPITQANFTVTMTNSNSWRTLVQLWVSTASATATNPNATATNSTLYWPTIALDFPVTTSTSTPGTTTLTWTLPTDSRDLQSVINAFNAFLAASGMAVLRVRLLGSMTYELETAAPPRYLDGRALRDPDPKSSTGLILPSGSGTVASDFEGLIFLHPTLQIVGLTLSPAPTTAGGPTAVTVGLDNLGKVINLDAGTPPTPMSPPTTQITATVAFNTFPVTDTVTISLALFLGSNSTPSSAIGSVVQPLPPTISVPASKIVSVNGRPSLTFGINIVGNPGATATYPFEVAATFNPLVGGGSNAAANFTVTGVLFIPPHVGPILGPPHQLED